MEKMEMRQMWLDQKLNGQKFPSIRTKSRVKRQDDKRTTLSVTTKTQSDKLKLLSCCQRTRFTMNWNRRTVQMTKKQMMKVDEFRVPAMLEDKSQ